MKILNFENQRILTLGKFLWKVRNNETPANIAMLFNSRTRVYGDNNYKYQIPTVNTELLKRNVVYQGPLVWNSIPADIKNKKNIFCFKKALRNYLSNKSGKHI